MFLFNLLFNNVDDEKSNEKLYVKRYYGWKKPLKCSNDFPFYKHDELYFLENIKHVDLRDKCPPIYD
jgi:hypothetical protein